MKRPTTPDWGNLVDYMDWCEKRIERLTSGLQKIIAEADSDDGLTAWDGADIARTTLQDEETLDANDLVIPPLPPPVIGQRMEVYLTGQIFEWDGTQWKEVK